MKAIVTLHFTRIELDMVIALDKELGLFKARKGVKMSASASNLFYTTKFKLGIGNEFKLEFELEITEEAWEEYVGLCRVVAPAAMSMVASAKTISGAMKNFDKRVQRAFEAGTKEKTVEKFDIEE